jgi:hypothetical protein
LKRSLVALIALAPGLCVGPAALAEVENVPSSIERFASLNGSGRPFLVHPHRAFPMKTELDPVTRPQPADPSNHPGETTRSATSKAGPAVSMSDFTGGSIGSGSGALLTPRGGTMSTPQQRAEREIGRVIRRLD